MVPKKWDLTIEEHLNKGSTSSVHKGHYGDIEVAVKCVRNKDCTNEIENLRLLSDETSIIHLYDFRTRSKETILLTELCKGGDLIDYVLRGQRPLPESEVKVIVRWLLKTITTCHARGIVHLDIKLDNIGLCSPDDIRSLKLLDFGNSRRIDDRTYTSKELLGTIYYLAPELITEAYIKGESALKKIDIWCIGIIAFSLLEGHYPFETVKAIADLKLSQMHSDPTTECNDFLKSLLCKTEDRPDCAKKCAEHKWFAST